MMDTSYELVFRCAVKCLLCSWVQYDDRRGGDFCHVFEDSGILSPDHPFISGFPHEALPRPQLPPASQAHFCSPKLTGKKADFHVPGGKSVRFAYGMGRYGEVRGGGLISKPYSEVPPITSKKGTIEFLLGHMLKPFYPGLGGGGGGWARRGGMFPSLPPLHVRRVQGRAPQSYYLYYPR